MDLTVVIPTWNTRELVLEGLTALEALDGSPDLDVVVVDNGSSDGTSMALAAEFPEVRRIELPRNLGFAAACNAGLRERRGRHALLLNTDARVCGGALERVVSALDAHPDVGVVGPQLLHPDGRPRRSSHRIPGFGRVRLPLPTGSARSGRRGGRAGAHASDAAEAGLVDVEAVQGAALFVSGRALDDVGLLNEDFFFFLEETDWCARFRQRGWRVVLLPAARVVHTSGASGARRHPELTRIEYHRSLYRFAGIHGGPLARAGTVLLRFLTTLLNVVVGWPLHGRSSRANEHWRAHRAVLGWHLAGQPDGVGLACAPEPGAGAGSDPVCGVAPSADAPA